MKITIKFDREFEEYQVPTQLGVTGEDQIYYTDDKHDAIETARHIHGPGVNINIKGIN
jgi:hypothetical protein